MHDSKQERQQLADILVERFEIGENQIEEARALADSRDLRLELAFAELGHVSDSQMALAIGQYLRIPVAPLAHFTPDPELLRKLPPEILTKLKVIPLSRWDGEVAVAMADPFDVLVIEELNRLLDSDVVPYVAPRNEMEPLLQRYETEAASHLEDVIRDVSSAGQEIQIAPDEGPDIEDTIELEDDAPVVRVVNSILTEAMHKGASDIHIEPMADRLLVRYRIDGILYDEPSPPHYMQWAIVSRIKIISGLDIAERRLPQDGRFTINAPSRKVDVRVSLIPTIYGQKAVLRILDKLNLKPDVASLELSPEDYIKIEKAIHQPSGLILITGPTGSGKTTTLYSALQEISNPQVNIITVEDPVEYQLPRINQIQAHPDIGLTFANGLRSILRQDPDIILVGEIRDLETASIAVEASLTGHLVLSTLHTNDSSGAVTRLVHMGVESFLLSSSLIMSQAQRIYRKLCPVCKHPRTIPWDILEQHNIDCETFREVKLFAPAGCVHCNHIGFEGREAIMEILEVDTPIRELILRQANANQIRDAAVAAGMVTLHEAGLQRVRRGITTIEEILRVTTT